ncbi:siphovirus Gp157 family protein [Candidatus Woesearchaeota archaeon]|nr:siphovirus Gp157 family protein [Candidatus Woesearchaeota archaeon]
MAKLFELTNELKMLEFYHEKAEEDACEGILDEISSVKISIKDKGINIAKTVKEMESDIEKFTKAECDIKTRKKLLEKKLLRLKEYLKTNMEDCSISHIYNEYIDIKIKENPPAVKIYNEDIVPIEYFNYKTIQTPDKALIARAIKNGKTIDGAVLEKGNRLVIK